MKLNKFKQILIFLVTLVIASCAMEPQPAFANTGRWVLPSGYVFNTICNFKMPTGLQSNTGDIELIVINKTTVVINTKTDVYPFDFKNQQQAFEWVQELLDGKKCTKEEKSVPTFSSNK